MLRRPVFGAVLAAGLALGLPGCTGATMNGQATVALTDALEEAASAVASSDLTVSLLNEDRLTATVADASLLDQIGVLEDSAMALTTLVPPSELGGARSTALTAVGEASSAIAVARAWVNGEAAPDDAPTSAVEVLEVLETAQAGIDGALAEVGS